MGACGGVLATCVHYVNQTIVKKRNSEENNKTEMLEYAKVFVMMTLLVGGTVFFMNKKNTFFKKKMLGGGSNNTLGSTPSNLENVSRQVTPTVNTSTVPTTQNVSVNPSSLKTVGGQTISSTVNNNLELSDINDVIHTGIPNF